MNLITGVRALLRLQRDPLNPHFRYPRSVGGGDSSSATVTRDSQDVPRKLACCVLHDNSQTRLREGGALEHDDVPVPYVPVVDELPRNIVVDLQRGDVCSIQSQPQTGDGPPARTWPSSFDRFASRRTFGPRGRYLMDTSSPVAMSSSRYATPKEPVR